MESKKVKNRFKIVLKWFGIVIGSILLLLVVLWFVLQTRWAQNIVRKEIVNFLEKKLDTKVSIARLSINYLYHLELEGVYLEDRSQKTLAYIGKLEAGYKLLDLMDNKLTISSVEVDSVRLNVYNSATDSVFNYNFITEAFAGTDTVTTTDTSSSPGMQFQIGDIVLSRADIRYNDAYYGQDFSLRFHKIDIAMDEFNLDSMIFRLDHLYTTNLVAGVQFAQTGNKMAEDTATSDAPMPRIGVDSILLAGTQIVYIDEKTGTDLNTVAGKLGIGELDINLLKSHASIGSFSLIDHNTSFATEGSASPDSVTKSPTDTSSAQAFTFAVNQVMLQNNSVAFDDNSKPKVKGPQIDFAHMKLSDLNTLITDIAGTGDSYKANIRNLRFEEQSGFILRQLRTNAVYSDEGVSLNRTVIQTNRSNISGSLSASYASIAEASENPGQVSIDASFSNTNIVINDLLYLQPALGANEYVKPLLGKRISLNTRVLGKLNNLNIPNLTIQQGSTVLNAAARVTGLPDASKMRIDLRLHQFSGTREGLLSLLPEDLIPASVHIPERFSIEGTYAGTTENMQADMRLKTSSGNLSLKGNITNAADSMRAVYDARIVTQNLRLDRFAGDTSLGAASVSFNVKGKGYAVKTADITLDGSIQSLEAKGYTYRNVDLKGRLSGNKVTAHLNSPDTNLLAEVDVTYDMNEPNPSLTARSNDMIINFQNLGLYQEHLIVKGKLDVDLANVKPDDLDGTVFITGLQIAHKDQVYPLDSLKVIAGKLNDSTDITIETPMLSANMRGLYKLTTVSQSMQAVIAHYTSDSVFADTSVASNQFRLTGTMVNHPIIRSFVPDLKRFTPLTFVVNMNSEGYVLNMDAGVKNIRYTDFTLDSLTINADSKNDSLLYNLTLNQVRHPSVPLNYTHIYGGLRGGNIGWNLDLHDREDRDKYFVGGTYNTVNGVSQLRLLPELLINKEKWTTNENNLVQLDSTGLMSANLDLMQGERGIQVKGTGSSSGLPISVNFMNFSLATIAGMIKSDTLLAEGLINGNIKLSTSTPLEFVADLRVDSIKAMSQPIGTLDLDASNTAEDVYKVRADLRGDSVQLTVDGDYTTSGEANLNFDIDIPQFSLKAIQPFVKDIMSNLSGMASGKMTLRGSTSSPEVRGSLGIKDAALVYAAYGTNLRIPDETIVFDEQGILLDDFTITDTLNNEAVIDGRVFTTDYASYRFDLGVEATNFRAIDNRLKPEQMIYGPASIDATLTVKGDMNLPVIEGRVRVRENSAVTVVIPSEDPQLESRRGIIRFVDRSNPIDSSLLNNANPRDTVAEDVVQGLSLSISAEITPETSMTIVLDEDNGDSLRVNGAATINMTIDPSGKTSMTGRYTVSEGVYILSLNQFIKRKFNIVKDGTINWTGEPTSATLDLSALYTTETTAEPLLNGAQNVPAGTVQQRLPFEVYLDLEGEMMQPDISFRLDMPEAERNVFDGVVYNRISQINNDESELNKQVMGLLVLNNFIGDNPFASLQSSGTSTETMAKGAAGKIIAQQLNNLAGNLIQGVDINFDFEQREDYTTGVRDNQSNLNVGLSKNLFNDRTTVTVGSSVPVEGSNQNTSGLTGNVTVDYKITRDGRYRLKIYRRNDNQTIVDGQVIETGVGFTLVMDYNEFREILQRSKRRQYGNSPVMDNGPRKRSKR